ncbi:hypothetical protein NDI49_27070 [Trichocoleus sp. ST-U3]
MDFFFHLLGLPFQAVGAVFQFLLTCFSLIVGLAVWVVSLPIILVLGIFKGALGILLSVVLLLGSPFGIGIHSEPVSSPQLAYQTTVNSDSSNNVAYKPITSEPMERSNYDSVRRVLASSQFMDDMLDKSGSVSSTPFGSSIRIANKAVQGGIYIEDWLHTDKEVERRINEVLSSPKLVNATEYPESYSQFEKYLKTSLTRWIPDRDYLTIGYLPKELLYDQSLGKKEITKYWPEATKEEQSKYVALTFDELTLNYELFWNDLR